MFYIINRFNLGNQKYENWIHKFDSYNEALASFKASKNPDNVVVDDTFRLLVEYAYTEYVNSDYFNQLNS